MKLIEDLRSSLNTNGKRLSDIKYVITADRKIPLEHFFTVAEQQEYDENEHFIAVDLMVVGDDWWMERGPYSEEWEYNELPYVPKKEVKYEKFIGTEIGDVSEYNEDIELIEKTKISLTNEFKIEKGNVHFDKGELMFYTISKDLKYKIPLIKFSKMTFSPSISFLRSPEISIETMKELIELSKHI